MSNAAVKASGQPAMQVNSANLETLAKYYPAPTYDRKALKAGVVHMSIGGFHRSHQAVYFDEFLKSTPENWMITAVGLMPQDDANINALKSQDSLYSVLQRSPDRDDVRIVGSIKDVIHAPSNPAAVIDAIASADTKIVSLTITEKGYCYNEKRDLDETNALVKSDAALPDAPKTAYGYLLKGLQKRRTNNIGPVTVMCCDNLPGNGELTHHLVIQFAKLADPTMVDWINQNVTFPNAMVDRITPVTTDVIRQTLADSYSIEDKWPVVCEGYLQWVLEDNFIAGRPALENVGVQLVKDVEPYEKMKVRLLNGSHSSLSYISYLCGHRDVDAAMADANISKFVRGYMDNDITPSLPAVPGVDLDKYKTTLIERFGNKSVRDQLQRLAEDGSQKIRNAIVPPLESQLASGGSVKYIAFALAAWYRYLTGVDEQNNVIEIKDPMKTALNTAAKEEPTNPTSLLAREEIFGKAMLGNTDFIRLVTQYLKDINEKGANQALADFLKS